MRGRSVRLHRHTLLALAALVPVAGCGVDVGYVLSVAGGQIDILTHSVPISEAIHSGTLSPEEIEKLRLLQDARRFAREDIGLNTSDNYTLFYDTDGEPVAYNVSASVRWAFVAKRWTFPIVGTVPYLGYFDRDQAILKVRELRQQGYDVFWYALDAYSTLDFLPNPVFSQMLRRSDLSLIETVLHELLHSTVWHSSDTTFNESLATFVGRTGAMDYLAARYPDEPERIESASQWYEDTDRYNAFLLDLYAELDTFYTGEEDRSAKINGREAMYQAGRDRFAAEVLPQMNRPENFEWAANLPTNNAWLLANVRYNTDLDVFLRVHQAVGADWAASLAVFHAAARASDPYAYLQAWLADNADADPDDG